MQYNTTVYRVPNRCVYIETRQLHNIYVLMYNIVTFSVVENQLFYQFCSNRCLLLQAHGHIVF